MTNQKSQSQNFCPESCHFCEEGLGLFDSETRLFFPYLSCRDWPHQEGPLSQPLFLSIKLLKGEFLKRFQKKVTSQSRVIVLIGEGDFEVEDLLALQTHNQLELWLIPSRHFDILSALNKIPTSLQNLIYFYCPLYNPYSDRFLTATELHRLFKKVKIGFPDIKISAPSGVDIYNSTLDPVDLKTPVAVHFKKSEASEIKISVIIPSYDNSEYVQRVVGALGTQDTNIPYEVIIVDDGSSDDTLKKLSRTDLCGPREMTVLHYPRLQGRTRGDFRFRAGAARHRGVQHARGEVLAFLDSDIIVPRNYIQELWSGHQQSDVIQIQRLYLTEEASQKVLSFNEICEQSDVFHPEGGYWKKFFAEERSWEDIPYFWKYVCTYGLSVRASLYNEIGGFKKVFNSYGFEDTDLGYRLAKKQARFHKSSLKAYHLWHRPTHSEFKNSALRRHQLLSRSANIFYRHHLDDEIFNGLGSLMFEKRFLRNRLKQRSVR